MIEIIEHPRGSGRVYSAARYSGSVLRLTAKPGRIEHVAIAGGDAAVRWLCDRSLRKSKAKKLVESILSA